MQWFAKPPNESSESSNLSLSAIWNDGRVWFKAAVLKTVVRKYRGFESYSFRHGGFRLAVKSVDCDSINSGSNPESHPKYERIDVWEVLIYNGTEKQLFAPNVGIQTISLRGIIGVYLPE